MASERDREIWDDATNAVCQAMQEHHMCNCPDGDCLAAKIDFSPEKIATATRPAPAATDTGLVTVDTQMRYRTIGKEIGDWSDWRDSVSPPLDPVRYDVETRELVTRSQAEELLAAERANTETALEQRNMTIAELARLETELAAERAEKEIAERNRDAARENFLMMQKTAAKLLERAEKAEADNAALTSEKQSMLNAMGDMANSNKKLKAKLAAAEKDRLPEGHIIIEQADMMDAQGRVSQTVQVTATGEEYERIVHVREAYGEDDNEYAR